jgi:hypothetical protein
MVECACFVYTCELFPGEWRALGISVSISAVFWWSIFFTAAASPAFANIGALYYLVFISMTTVMAVIVAFVFPDVSFSILILQSRRLLTHNDLDLELYAGANGCCLRG